jgi:hypothetical protein
VIICSYKGKGEKTKLLQSSMTLQKIKKWIKEAEHITTDRCEDDANGNNYARDIFRKDGKLYIVEYINGEIVPYICRGELGGLSKHTTYSLKEV